MIELTIKLLWLTFIWCGLYLLNSVHCNNWKPTEIPKSTRSGLFTKI